MRRIAKSSGATILTTMANPDGTESFDSELLGEADVVYEDTVGDMDYLFIEVNIFKMSLLNFIGNEKSQLLYYGS